jgi:hypothetical protein
LSANAHAGVGNALNVNKSPVVVFKNWSPVKYPAVETGFTDPVKYLDPLSPVGPIGP